MKKIIPVVAEEYAINDEVKVAPMGIDELCLNTLDCIDEAKNINKENRESLVVKNAFQATRIKNSICGYSLFSTVMSPKYRDDMYISGKDNERMKSMKEVEELI